MPRTEKALLITKDVTATRRLRVVHVVNSFGLGGMEKGIATCVSHSHPDFCHAIVCLTESGPAEALLPAGTPVRQVRKPPGNSLRAIVRLARELRRLRPCMVHTRNWAGVDGIIAARLAGIRTVLHGEHGWDVEDLHGDSRKRRFLRRNLSGFTAGFTCVSKHIASWLTEAVQVRCPVTQICNGVDTDLYRPGPDRAAVRQELGIPPTTLLVGHVARLVAVKNHDALFRAFEAVRNEIGDTVLVCIGDGPREAELQRLAGPGVRFLGNRTDVPRLLRAMDLFVLPSLNEGISNTILEGMATGLPVVATDVGGSSELVEHEATGLLVPSEDEHAFAEAMRSYLVDEARRREHGRRARAIVVEQLGLERMVRAYEHVWRSCAGLGPQTQSAR